MIFFSFSSIELTFQFFCQKISHWIVKTESYVSTGNLGRNIFFFEKTLAALIVFGSERKNFGLLAKLFGRVVQTAFDLSMGSFWEVFLKKNQIQFIILAHWANAFRHSVKNFLAGLLENTIWSFNHCRTLSKMFSFFCQKKLLQCCQNCILCVYRNSLNELFFWKKVFSFFYIIRTLSEKLLAFYQFFFEGVVKSVFYISMGTFRRKIFSIILIRLSIRFRNMNEKNSVFPQAFFGRFEKTAVYVSIDRNWGKRFGKKLFSVTFGQQTKTFRL